MKREFDKDKIFCSIVMPVHNGEKFLAEAIESVLKQTYTNFEFLIIENCSTDKSFEIIKSYKDPRIKLIIEEECGIVQAYNRGFIEAKGEYVIIHDQDDISLSNRIESLINFAVEKALDICGSSFEVIDSKNNFIKEIKPPVEKEEIMNRILFDVSSLFNPTLLVRKNVLKELNFFNYSCSYGADYDFILRTLKNYRASNFSKVLLRYRIHKDSTSRKNEGIVEVHLKEKALNYYKEFTPFLYDKDFVLARIYYFFENYFSASKYFVKSIKKKGLTKETLKYFSYSSFLVVPIFLARKIRLNHSKFFNMLINGCRKVS